MMDEARTPRAFNTREKMERPKSWQPAAILPEPIREDGYSYRWVRISTRAENDPTNISSKMREGWEPVRVEEQPHLKLLSDPQSRFKGNIEVGGLLLCKIPSEFMEQRKAYYDNMNKSQIESVDNNFMRENDPRMPLFREKRSTISFGKGN